MSRAFKWFSALIIILFGIGTYLSITNRTLGPLSVPFDYQTFNWEKHRMSFDTPQGWTVYARDDIFVMAHISEANKNMIPDAIAEGIYRLQYTAYPEVTFFGYPEKSMEDHLKNYRDCVVNQTGRFVQVDCERPLPGNRRTEATRFYLFNREKTLVELAIGAIALSQEPDQVEHIVNSITFK